MIATLADRAIAWQAAQTIAGLVALGAVLTVVLRGRRREGGDSGPKPALWLRLGTLLALGAIVLGAAYWGAWPFAVVVAALVALGLAEFWALLDAAGSGAYRALGWLGGVALVPAAVATRGAAMGGVLVALVVAFLARALAGGDRAQQLARLGGTAFGVLYVALTLAHLALLRVGPGGFGRVLFVFVVVQMADVFALLGGLAFGRHKLAPTLSPGKTWEGFACGLLSALAGAWLFDFTVPGLALPLAFALAALLAAGGLLGDLSASALKRAVGFKDFGRTLPGHGGVLDRFDSYLVAAPLAYYFFVLAGS